MIDDAVFTYYKAQAKKRGSLIRACRHISKRLNHRWTADYLYLVLEGKSKPGLFLISKLNLLVAPGKPRYRLKTEAETKEEFESWKTISNKRRAALFNQEVKDNE